MITTRARHIVWSALAAVALSGAPVIAQNGPPPPGHWDDAHWGNGPEGYSEYYQEGGHPNFGARRGYSVGYDMGVSDRRGGHSYRPTHLDEFKNVPDSPPGVSRDDFKHFYREAFIKGYQRGYGH